MIDVKLWTRWGVLFFVLCLPTIVSWPTAPLRVQAHTDPRDALETVYGAAGSQESENEEPIRPTWVAAPVVVDFRMIPGVGPKIKDAKKASGCEEFEFDWVALAQAEGVSEDVDFSPLKTPERLVNGLGFGPGFIQSPLPANAASSSSSGRVSLGTPFVTNSLAGTSAVGPVFGASRIDPARRTSIPTNPPFRPAIGAGTASGGTNVVTLAAVDSGGGGSFPGGEGEGGGGVAGSTVPEPSSIAGLASLGLFGLYFHHRRRKRYPDGSTSRSQLK